MYGNNIATTFILTFYLFIYFYFYMRIALVGLSPRVRGCAFYYLYELASMKTTENSSPLSPRLSLKCVLRLRCICVAFALRFLIACYNRVSPLLIYHHACVCTSRPCVLLEEACKEGLTWTSHILTSCGVVWFPPYRHRRYISGDRQDSPGASFYEEIACRAEVGLSALHTV